MCVGGGEVGTGVGAGAAGGSGEEKREKRQDVTVNLPDRTGMQAEVTFSNAPVNSSCVCFSYSL